MSEILYSDEEVGLIDVEVNELGDQLVGEIDIVETEQPGLERKFGGGLVEDQAFIEKADPISTWEKAKRVFGIPGEKGRIEEEGARAVQALVDAEALTKIRKDGQVVSPSMAYKYRDMIDKGKEINPTIAAVTTDLTTRVKQSWDTGLKQKDKGFLGSDFILTGNQESKTMGQAISLPGPYEEFISESFIEDSVRSAAKMAPIMADIGIKTAVGAVKMGSEFGLIAAILGQAGPQALAMEEVITVPAAIAAGMKTGAFITAWKESFKIEGGLSVFDILEFEDAEGNKIDENIARLAGAAIGGVNAFIEVAQLKGLLKTIPIFNQLKKGSLRSILASDTVKNRLFEVSKKYGSFLTTETIQEVLQEVTNVIFEEVAKKVSEDTGGAVIDTAKLDDVMDRLTATGVDALKGFLILGAPGTVMKGGLSFKKVSEETTKDLPIATQEEFAKLSEQEPDAIIIGTQEDAEGNVIGYTMADINTGNTFEVGETPTVDEIKQGLESVKDLDTAEIDIQISKIIDTDESKFDAEVDRILAEPEVIEEIGEKTQAFREQVARVVPEEEAQAVNTLLDARAKAVGITTDEYIEYHGLDVEKADVGLGKVKKETPQQEPSVLFQDKGEYSGEHEAPTNDGHSKPLHDMAGIYPEDIYSLNGARYYGDGSNFDQESISILSGLREKPNKRITIYRAVPKIKTNQELIDNYYKEKAYILKRGKLPIGVTNWSNSSEYYDFIYDEIERLEALPEESKAKKISINIGDWVTINRKYAVGHGKSALNNEYKIISKTVKAKEIYTDGNSIHEQGYDPTGVLKQDTKASVTFTDTKTIISAFETADVSSLVHELGHVFRRDIGGEDLIIAENWAGVKGGVWTVESEEKFARGFENYLATGKAPTAELTTIFEKFKQWMSEIYNSIKGSSIDVDITPEIQDVFDRLLIPAEDVTIFEQAAESIKTRVRRVTAQARGIEPKIISERDALRFAFKKAATSARVAFREGKKEETAKQKLIMKEKLSKLKLSKEKAIGKILTEKEKIKRRKTFVRTARDFFGLTDNDLKKISRKDIRLMSDYEYKKFLDNIWLKSVEIADTKQAKLELMQTINKLRLGKVDNYRQALELPTFGKMTAAQLREFDDIISQYEKGDVFLTKRELETVDRTDLRSIRTWREARASLAKETGVSIEDLEKVKVNGLDSFRWDTALAERNPFYNLMVNETTKTLLKSQMRFHEVETEIFRLSKAAQKSRKRGIIERAIPQDEQIFDYLEAKEADKEGIANEMTLEQIELAHYIQEYFGQALDYLVQVQALEKGRDNYFVHMRRTYLESVRDDGLIKGTLNLFKNYEQDQMVFEILDDNTGNILPLEKFFQFSLRRTGQLTPTKNITKAFLGYASAIEKKKALDSIIPKLDIYAQSLTPSQYTPRGLEIDRSLKKFLNKYLNNKKGRRISFDSVVKQGGEIDLILNAMRTFITVVDLGLNIPVGIASFFGEQIATIEMLGVPGYTKGTARGKTKKGKAILKKYQEFIGRSAWENFSAPGQEITSRLASATFGLFHISSVTANKQFLLGSITKEEYDAGEISHKRLAELKLEMGRFRVVPGTESLMGSTSVGKGFKQYKSWAAPIIRTLSKDMNTFINDARKKPIGEVLTSREAKELYRMVGITTTVLIVGSMAAISDDDDFISQTIKRIYRESLTLMQGISPALWTSTPRILVFLAKLGVNIEAIIKLEENKRDSGLKGVTGLQKQFTPRVIKQITKD